MMNSEQQLLNQINTISKTYDLVAKSTGENYNIFKILGLESAEVKTHSRFLAELLNPKGSHLQGDLFLRLFINYINHLTKGTESEVFEDKLLSNAINLNFYTSNVSVEKHIGKVIDEEGGRIDICIIDSHNNIICIENKIYAREGDKQMQRYSNYAKKYKYSYLFFLTLWGNEPETKGEEIIYPISYKKHIVEWLELCKKEAVNLPILRESIGQYINLIKKLTNQTTNKEMEKDVQKVILNNVADSFIIYRNFETAVYSLYNLIIRNLVDKLNIYLEETEWHILKIGFIQKYSDRGLIFLSPKYLECHDGFGVEEFNPLANKHNNFGNKIFFGITNWKQDRGFLDQAKGILKANSYGGWINYDFPKSNIFDFNLSTMELINYLKNDAQIEEFTNEIYRSFIEYFEKNEKAYLEYLKRKDLIK